MKEKQNIGALFDRIAGKYDFLNHLLSLNIDKRWRRKAVRAFMKNWETSKAEKSPNVKVLDVAIGTADLSVELARKLGKQDAAFDITGIDLSTEMMRIGEEKVRKHHLQEHITFMKASALEMPFDANSYDVVTCSYGVRNFSNLDQGLKEMQRVLKPGGQLMILEFSYPKNRFVAWSYDLYFSHIMPTIGRLLSKDRTAYTYLNRSVKNFVWGEEMCKKLASSGFSNIKHKPLTFGISTIYTATKDV